MRYIKLLIMLSIFLSLFGCQNKDTHKYVVYNLDEELAQQLDSGDFVDSSYFLTAFALPLTTAQLDVLEGKDINIYPYYMCETKDLKLYKGNKIIEGYSTSFYTIFPYIGESKLDKLTKKYVGEIDPQKEYIYISETAAIGGVMKDGEIVEKPLINLFEDEFKEEYSIKLTMQVPIKAMIGQEYENYNYVDYGPYNNYTYETIEVEKEYYINGIVSEGSNYEIEGAVIAYVDSKQLEPLYSLSKDVEPAVRIVESNSKDIENSFKELGLRYYKLNK